MVRRVRVAVVLLVVAAALTAVAASSQADFAAATGFSGRNGFTCVSCHVPTLDPVPPAEVTVSGLPEAWGAGDTYELTVQVTGGPPALPAPAPQGGFELDTEGGTLSIPAGMEEALRLHRPNLMTYTPAGTLMREWRVDWNAPGIEDLRGPPGEIRLWVAAVAANGNHNAQLNLSTGGEHGDRTASEVYVVPPSTDAVQAWADLPLAPPSVSTREIRPAAGDDAVLTGLHMDGNATHVGWRVGDGPWTARETGSAWRLVLKDLPPGTIEVEVRSEGAGRVSQSVAVQVQVPGGLFGDRSTPTPGYLLPTGLVLTALWVRARR